jgi:hypothetical protein
MYSTSREYNNSINARTSGCNATIAPLNQLHKQIEPLLRRQRAINPRSAFSASSCVPNGRVLFTMISVYQADTPPRHKKRPQMAQMDTDVVRPIKKR